MTTAGTAWPPLRAENVSTVFGNTDGVLGCLTTDGQLCITQFDQDGVPSFHPQGTTNSPKLSHIAIDGAGRIAIILLQQTPSLTPATVEIHEFASIAELLTWFFDPTGTVDPSSPEHRGNPYVQPGWSRRQYKHPKHFSLPGTAQDLQAGATFFTLLLTSGQLFTWGDARHHHCLGREPSATAPSSPSSSTSSLPLSPSAGPATEPALVDALDGVPIAKIACGGWITAALSRDRDLYLLGRSPPCQQQGRQGIAALPNPLEGEMMKLVDIDGVLNVLDVGVGTGHVVALVEGALGPRLFAVGDNSNGQLGLGADAKGFVSRWTEARLPRGEIRNVVCGPLNTFLLVEK